MIGDIADTLLHIAEIADCLLFQRFGMNRYMQKTKAIPTLRLLP